MGLAKIGAAITLDGEKEYRRAISGINTSMTTLKSELRLCSAEFEGQANSMEALSRKNDILNRMYQAQEERCRTMAGALQEATATYGENSRQAQEWQTRLNNATAELTRMGRELETNNGYLEEARNSTTGCATSIDAYGRQVREASDSTTTFGEVLKANLTSEVIINGIKALGSAVKSLGESAINTVRDTAAYADNILTMSNNTGIATDTLQELSYMQELTDVSLEQVTSSMAKQIKSMANAKKGTADYVNAYSALGVVIQDANGNLRDSEEVYWECIDALGKVENETQRDTIAMQLFGKSAQDLNSLIKIGSEGVAEFAQEARDMGAVMSDDVLSSLGETDDAFQRIDQSMLIFKRELGIAMGPSITKSIEKVTDKITGMGDELSDAVSDGLSLLTDGLCWIIDNADTIITALAGIASGFVAYKAVSGIQLVIEKLKSLSITAGGAKNVISGLWSAISSNPAALAAVSVGVLASAFVAIKDRATEASDEVVKVASESQKAVEEAKELVKNIEELSNPRNNKFEAVKIETDGYRDMVDRLYDLADSEKLSNEQKERMSVLVDKLNEKMPNLNLQFDKQTGAISKTREEAEKYVEQFENTAMIAAGEAQLQAIMEEKLKAQRELAILQDEYVNIEEKWHAFKNTPKPSYSLFNDDLAKWLANDKYYLERLTENKEAQLHLKNAITQSEKEYEKTTNLVSENTKVIEESTEALENYGTCTKSVSEQVQKNFEAIAEKYTEVKEAAEKSILEQIGLFDEYKEESKYSKEEILANLQSQIDGMNNWSTNMDKAAELGVDEKILKQFRDMGLDSSEYLNEIVKMTESEIEEMNKLYEEKLTIADTVSSEMAAAETKLDEALTRMENALLNRNMTLPISLQPTNNFVPQQNTQIKDSGVISNEYRQQMMQKAPEVNVYIGNEKIVGAVQQGTKSMYNRYNPIQK